MAFLAQKIENAGQIAGLETVDHVGSARPFFRHAHVERTVLLEGEAALGLIDLHRRHANIEHNAVHLAARSLDRRDRVVQGREPGLDQIEPARKLLFHRPPGFDCSRIAVNRDHVRTRFEYATRVTTRAECPIDDHRARCGLQGIDHFGNQHRNVTDFSPTGLRIVSAEACHHSDPFPGTQPVI